MEIRAATADDVEQVLPLVAKVIALHESWDDARFGAKPHAARNYRGWLTSRSEDDSSVFLVAEHAGQIVAFLIGTTDNNIPIYRVERYGYIHDLWVESDYRHEGVARSMTMLAVERFKKIGVTQVRLETAMANDAARSLFEACGFRASTIEMLCEL